MLDEEDKQALIVLLTRVIRAGDERNRAEAQRKRAQERMDSAIQDVTLRRAAFGAFGFDAGSSDLWDQVKAAIGVDAYKSAFIRARPATNGAAPLVDDDVQLSNKGEIADPEEKPSATETRSIREITLSELGAAGENGLKAAEIRQLAERIQGRVLHEKTVGMTLYRLSKDGLVRREGRTWFLVSTETRDPGVSAPGPETSGNQEGDQDA